MADERIIRIIIGSKADQGEEEKGKESDSTSGLKTVGKFLHPIQAVGKLIDDESKIGGHIFRNSVSILNSTVESGFSRYFNLKEDYLSQNALNNAKTAINKAQSLGTSVLSGAIVGAGGGPAGMMVTATVSAITWGANEFINARATMSNYYQALNASNYQVGFSQVRAGLIDNGRGTEN